MKNKLQRSILEPEPCNVLKIIIEKLNKGHRPDIFVECMSKLQKRGVALRSVLLLANACYHPAVEYFVSKASEMLWISQNHDGWQINLIFT